MSDARDPSSDVAEPADIGAGGSQADASASAATGGDLSQASLWGDAWRSLRTNPLFLISGFLLVVVLTMAAFPQLFATLERCDLADSLGRPSRDAWFGYDALGCDYYARTIYGARASIVVGVMVVLVAATIAVVLGSLAGYYRGWIDSLLSRITDVTFALPAVLAGIVILSVLENRGIPQVAFVLSIVGWPTMLRLMRSTVMSVSETEYVQSARALGASDLRIIVKHVLPNALTPVIVYATIYVGIVISAEATLTFLGVGLQPPAISWGLAIANAQRRLLQAPHLLLFPGLFLSITVFSFILMGDALRDALDPKLR